MNPNLPRQRGAVAIMVAVSMFVLLAVVGLCVDAGLAYLVKARLNAAVDSAALAGARAVTTGNNQTEQIASARAAAADFFAANIPSNYLLSSPRIISTNVTFNGGQATIDVKAEAPMPVSIMQIMKFTSLTPVAAAQTIRNDLDMALVIDTSGSLKNSATTVQASAKSFLSKFNVTQDRVALIHFASGVEMDNAINTSARGFNRPSMNSKINSYLFTGGTSSFEGMWKAREQLNSVPLSSRSTMRVIVFFSDGAPTSFGSYLTFNTPTDCTRAGSVDRVLKEGGLGNLGSSDLEILSEGCKTWRMVNNREQPAVRRLPDWYNARPESVREFPIVTTTPRVVTADISTPTLFEANVLRASRNLAESIAVKTRSEGIYVFTLGFGPGLKEAFASDTSTNGEMIMKCMANTADALPRCRRPDQPVGMYCYAATDNDLTPCFSRLASAILRITK
ncbi:VWA domain-containing protein [Oxalobacteraceae sp. CFBP 8753]|jgi:Flp pilus assembly protein TadG|nr:VWA domain-containing protein [Oxalobacteraceae sp. CFBP 8753]